MRPLASRLFSPVSLFGLACMTAAAYLLFTHHYAFLFAAVGGVLLLRVVVWHREKDEAVVKQPARIVSSSTRPLRYPSVTVVRPVRGADVGAAENFAAALDTGYPGQVETLFIFDDDEDPGLPIARAVVEQHTAECKKIGRDSSARVVIAGPPPPGRTGKLNAMVVGQRAAHGELIAFGDSDTRPDHDVLRCAVESLMSTPNAGSAFAPILVNQPHQGLGDVFYALMQNALYAPLAAWAAGPTRTLPFIMGQLMVFTRPALEAIGGVACADGQLVDDMYIGKCVHEAGFANVLSYHPLHVATGGLTLKQFMPVFRRWMMFSRNGLPVSFTWRQWMQGAEFPLALGCTIFAVASGLWIAAALWGAAFIAMGYSLIKLQRDYGGAPIPLKWAWAAWGFFAMAPYVAASAFFDKRVEWRGRQYAINSAAGLALEEAKGVLAAGRPISSLDNARIRKAPAFGTEKIETIAKPLAKNSVNVS